MPTDISFTQPALVDKLTLTGGNNGYFDFGAAGANVVVVSALADTEVLVTGANNVGYTQSAIPTAGASPRTPTARGSHRWLTGKAAGQRIALGGVYRYVFVRSSASTDVTVEGGVVKDA